MTNKDRKEIALNLSVLMMAILDKNSDSGEVANNAISFCAQMLKQFPEIKDIVEEMILNDWDTEIAWIEWGKQMLK
jgi:hypothetical protein